ncbi:xanthine dehydrogenase family protein molybdopterin-binding subunit [Desulfitobacterium sp.]|uniref:xanthine dehydrogenase family protein molybdopterin-binding subunit n=1 Tax=Desulfitobacterium sp. TaxID=49981 RepID=UPI002B21D696|nr:molybdopterin cofactor-binding domain-containing protein [Desulfitobacterium sp.]MEA4900283.1 molybdopterin cofactor-binding domain-containing protein [Desulfitobacterium sp.]
MKEYTTVGKSVRKLDALEKATGTATFSTDFSLPGMLYGKVLRSPYPHARIIKIDTTEAEKLPGVKAVATYQNTPRELFNTSATMTFTVPSLEPVLDQYIFDNVVRYVGDEVAAVAATSERIAEEALKLIKVEYEELPAVFDPLEAMKPEAPDIQGPCREGKNIPGETVKIPVGDVAKGFAESDIIIEKQFKLPIQKQAQLETQAAVAQVGVDGKITVWSTTQTPHPTRMILSKIFGVPHSKIRVLNPPYVGGGFGVRIGLSAKAEPIAVALSILAKKPVKIVYSREEDFIASDTRHGGYVTVKLGAKSDGTFHALDLRAVLDAGAYCSFSCETPGVLGAMGLSVYRIPNEYYYGHSVYTNKTPAGAMRGFGNPQAMFPIESVVDMMAEKLNMDPLELRMKNIMKVGDPWCLPYPCQSTGLAECIEKGAKSIGWERRGKLNKPGAKKLRGIGVGVGTHCSNAWPFCVDYDNAIITVQQDGSIHLASGVPDIGTGTSTTLPQFAAEVLGARLEDVNITFADTQSTPFDIGSHASRTCYAAGTAVVAAATDARKQILEYAGNLFEVPPENLDIKDSEIYIINQNLGEDCKGSGVCQIGEGKKTMTLKELAYHAHLRNKQFIGVGRIVPGNAPPWHAHFAEVEVDTETGQVKVIKVAAAHDVGKAINPVIVEGQIEGGVLMGVGYAVSEEIRYDDKGRQIHSSLHKYFLPTIEDTPEIDAILVESNEPSGPFGAKGVGETGLVPTAGAIANAVYDATGVRFYEIPLTEERVYKALKQNGY